MTENNADGSAAAISPAVRLSLIREQIAAGEGLSALRALDELRQAFPEDDAIGLYWSDVGLCQNQVSKIKAYILYMHARAKDGMPSALWGHTLGTAHMLLADFPEACCAFAKALESLINLAAVRHAPAVTAQRNRSLVVFDVEGAQRRLWTVLGGLKDAGLHVFPMFGTLLGLTREGKLLPFDKDLDLCVWMEDWHATRQYLLSIGMLVAPMSPPYDNFLTFVDQQTGLTFDVCGLRREPEHQKVTGGFWVYDKPASYQRVSSFPWFELKSGSKEGFEVWLPTNPEALLTAIYGDWHIPRPEWDSVVSALNVQRGSDQQRCYAYGRLVKHWLTGDLAKARRYVDQVLFCLPGDALSERCLSSLDNLLFYGRKK